MSKPIFGRSIPHHQRHLHLAFSRRDPAPHLPFSDEIPPSRCSPQGALLALFIAGLALFLLRFLHLSGVI